MGDIVAAVRLKKRQRPLNGKVFRIVEEDKDGNGWQVRLLTQGNGWSVQVLNGPDVTTCGADKMPQAYPVGGEVNSLQLS